MNRYSNVRSYCVLLLITMVAAGCHARKATVESDRAGVAGKVTIDGKPLTGGSITFVSTTDVKCRMTTIIRADGSFRVPDAPAGPTSVSIESESVKMGYAPNYMPIPAKYGNIKTSGLTVEIRKDSSEPVNFDLTSK